jgi:hypothetical protein
MMIAAAKSSYFAWLSRGSWPKRPKAHGAVVEVGKNEKEEDIVVKKKKRAGICVGDFLSGVKRVGAVRLGSRVLEAYISAQLQDHARVRETD